jgi:hypothetical protein
MPVSEEQLLRQLGAALEVVPGWLDTVGTPSGKWTARDGSDLAQDDVQSHPINVSSAAWHAIVAAVSHLDCFRDSLFKPEGGNTVTARIATHGQYSLLRGALENASRALWLLEPDRRVERILRRLQQDWSEQRQLNEVGGLINWTNTKSMEDRFSELVGIAERAGIATPNRIKSMPGYGEIVRNGAIGYSGSSDLPYLIWKACSALAHGDLRGSLVYIRTESMGASSPGMVLGRMSGSVHLLTRGGQTAIAATRAAFGLYAQRGGQSGQRDDDGSLASM